MNDFSKIYSTKQLSDLDIVTMMFLPLEESIMVPVSQAIDLMKQGENIIYFSFNYDSIKVNDIFKSILKSELEPGKITGNIAIIDASQIPLGMDYLVFMNQKIEELKNSCPIKFVFMDILGFRGGDKNSKTDKDVLHELKKITFEKDITAFLFKYIDLPSVYNVKDKEQVKKIEEIISKEITINDLLKENASIAYTSDLIMSVSREKKSFWKKITNFLLFWRKKNNFALRVLKNRNGIDGNSFRMNIDVETSKVEIL